MIKRIRCPFVGLKDDPTTALNYPSQGNFCHHARPVSSLNGSYQQQYCLTTEHTACPIFLAAQPQPLPAAMAAPTVNANPKRTLAFIAIPILLAGTTALALAWNVLGSRVGGEKSIPVTSLGAPAAWSLLVTETQNPPTASPTTKPSETAQLLRTECPRQPGWVSYIVNPTDSLYRLSVIYGVPVEQLQQVNCLDDQTVIFPGQVLYVPNMPTDTPFPTITPVTIFPTSTPKPREQEAEPAPPADTAQPPRPTAQPTNPPKIDEPVPAQPTDKPGKQDPDKKDDNKDQNNKDDDKDDKKDEGDKGDKGKDKDNKGKGKGK